MEINSIKNGVENGKWNGIQMEKLPGIQMEIKMLGMDYTVKGFGKI